MTSTSYSSAQKAAGRRLSFGRRILLAMQRPYNAFAMTFAGRRASPFGVIKHRGRRSGREYATPLALRPTASGFVVPLAWGAGTDWARNLVAAGGGVVRWHGADYPVVSPRFIHAADALSAFSPLSRAVLRLSGLDDFLRLEHAPTAAA